MGYRGAINLLQYRELTPVPVCKYGFGTSGFGTKGNGMAERRLKTSEDARRYLAYLIRQLEADRLDAGKAGKLGYLCSLLVRAIEGSELEKRLDELEGKASGERACGEMKRWAI
jgi:hypothetical protein